MRANSVVIGNEFEKESEKILEVNGFTILNNKVARGMPYDIIAEKDSKKFYIEVKGRKEGKQQRNFSINEIKVEKLINCDSEVLFLFINNRGYVICSLDDVINKSPLKIGTKKIFLSFNRSFRKIENDRTFSCIVNLNEGLDKKVKHYADINNLSKQKAIVELIKLGLKSK